VDQPSSEAAFADLATRLTAETDAMLAEDGIEPARRRSRLFAGLRYLGQFHELSIEIAPALLPRFDPDAVLTDFHTRHAHIYGHSAPDKPVEFVSLQVDALGEIDRPHASETPNVQGAAAQNTGTRMILLDAEAGKVAAQVFERAALNEGASLTGPAIITQLDSTVIVGPGETATVATDGAILIERKAKP
jgi:N-methylhydantoinase A